MWDLVVVGDSAWNGIGFLVARAVEDAQGVEVSLHEWINPDQESYLTGGERSADLLQRLRADEDLRRDLSEAEMILFDVPMGVVNDVCPGDPGVGTVEMAEACMPEASAAYRADVGPIFEELVALRDPSEAVIRVADLWQFFYPTFRDHGTYDVVRPAWQEMNGAVADAADQHGIPLIHAYDAFSGQGGDRDPVAAGDVTGDQVHLAVEGQQRLAALILDLGFEPLG